MSTEKLTTAQAARQAASDKIAHVRIPHLEEAQALALLQRIGGHRRGLAALHLALCRVEKAWTRAELKSALRWLAANGRVLFGFEEGEVVVYPVRRVPPRAARAAGGGR